MGRGRQYAAAGGSIGGGATGYDEWGYPTQRTLWTAAEAVGAFGFSRPEDVATNPVDGTEIVLASTGVDTYAVDSETGNGVDTFGTIYTVTLDFGDLENPTAALTILYDGDADGTRALRSPDNLDWADEGDIYSSCRASACAQKSATSSPSDSYSRYEVSPHRGVLFRYIRRGGRGS